MLDVDVSAAQGSFSLNARLTADPGITVLFGRSGSGKTTLIDMMAGLRTPAAGRIRLGDQIVFDSAAGINLVPEKRAVGYVFQDARLFPHLSVRANLLYGWRRAALSKSNGGDFRFDDIVALLEIGHLLDRRPSTLSGGEAQRVAIGRALLRQPEVVLLDEPLSALDVASREQLLPFIGRLASHVRRPVVFVSHNIEDVIRIGDTMALMSDGGIVATGPVDEIMGRIDLGPLTGRHESGAIIDGVVASHDEIYGLSAIRFAGDRQLHVSRVDLAVGERIRIRVRSRDVGLARTAPSDTSFLNILPATVKEIAADNRRPQADVRLDAGVPIIARVTRKSIDSLGIKPGLDVFVLLKSVAIDRRSMGRSAVRDDDSQN